MKRFPVNGRTLALLGVIVPLFAGFIYVALRSGPLAPVPVTVAVVQRHAITPALFGLGTVEARYNFKIGPTLAGRVLRVNVEVGDRVRAGQLLGEMDPVDYDDRIAAQNAALRRAEAGAVAAEAQVQEVSVRQRYAATQAQRYEKLRQEGSSSAEAGELKQQELQVAEAGSAAARANLEVARQELVRLRADRDVLRRQRANLRLIAPQEGLVTLRHADPGTTVVAGQAVVEMIDPASLWINVRFDQLRATGLRSGLPAGIVLRSQAGRALAGYVLRVEPVADAVTEETLAKVVFDTLPESLPPLGELVEVTVVLPPLPETAVVANASVQRVDGQLGVWLMEGQAFRFAPVQLGANDLDGRVQIMHGLEPGASVVVYSQRALGSHTRVKIVERLPGVAQ